VFVHIYGLIYAAAWGAATCRHHREMVNELQTLQLTLCRSNLNTLRLPLDYIVVYGLKFIGAARMKMPAPRHIDPTLATSSTLHSRWNA